METIKSITKKDKHNTKQIKYRRKLNLVLPYHCLALAPWCPIEREATVNLSERKLHSNWRSRRSVLLTRGSFPLDHSST